MSCTHTPSCGPMRSDATAHASICMSAVGSPCSWAASPTTSPARPTSPTTWCAAACARCRPSACLTTRAGGRRRCRRGRAQVAHRAGAEAVAAVAGGAALAARAGRDADLLQVLLDLRLHAARQHRPGHRGADGCAAAPTSPSPRPAFPENARTVFKGHLFVGDVLLSDSGMRDHPLTPMTDANLVRVLQAQYPARGRKVGLIDYRGRRRAPAAIRARIARCARRRRDRHRRRARTTTTCCASAAALGDAAAGHRRLRRGHRPAAATARHRRRATRGAAAAGARLSAHRLGQLLGWRRNAQVRPSSPRRRGALPIDPAARSPRATTSWPATRWPGPAARWRQERRCWSMPRRSPTRSRRCRRSSAPSGPARWSSRRCRASRVAWSSAACGQLVVAGGETSGACVQALGHRADCASARRSTPACRGAMRHAGAAARAAPGAEVRQLRQRRLLHQGLRRC